MKSDEILKIGVDIFGKLTKEEAFLKGVLFGYGTHQACPMPNWELMKEYPRSVDTEQKMRQIFEEIHKSDIEEAQRLLASIKGR